MHGITSKLWKFALDWATCMVRAIGACSWDAAMRCQKLFILGLLQYLCAWTHGFRSMIRTRTVSHNAKMEVIIRDLSKKFYTPSISDLQNLAHLNDLFNALGLLLWTFCRCHKDTGKTTREPIEFCSLSFHLESETVFQGVLKTYKLNLTVI